MPTASKDSCSEFLAVLSSNLWQPCGVRGCTSPFHSRVTEAPGLGGTPGLPPPAAPPSLLLLTPSPSLSGRCTCPALPRTWRTTTSFFRLKGSKPFSKTLRTLKFCRVRSRRRRLCAPSTTRTDRKFLGSGGRQEVMWGSPGWEAVERPSWGAGGPCKPSRFCQKPPPWAGPTPLAPGPDVCARGDTHRPFRQCAADRTKLRAMRVAPQKWPPRRCSEAMKGQACGRAARPPTISEASAGPGGTGGVGR